MDANPQNAAVIEKTPYLVIHFEATGVVFERFLSGDQLTADNIVKAMSVVGEYALPSEEIELTPVEDDFEFEFDLFDEDEIEEGFPEEAARAESSYWDYMVSRAAEEIDEPAPFLVSPKEIKGYKVGDRVEYIGEDHDFDGEPLKGKIATIRTLDSSDILNIGLEFDDSITGHNLDDRHQIGDRGWYVEADGIRAGHFDAIKVGDLVEVTEDAEEYEDFKDYYGEVITVNSDRILVEWLGWNWGHTGGIDDDSTSRWWMSPEDIVKA